MKFKILYVDDERSNLRIFKDSFRRDYEIFVAESGFEALKLLKNHMVDLVITDQRMPGMTGVELLKEITEKYDDIPPSRVILSGYAEDDDIKRAFAEFRLSKFIPKPWNYEELKNIISSSIQND
ncbi:response regulator [Maribellus comscasis]|uniref:Response regulator n=1 Tax=Maribellus comscasis TaxID=2681766 RepID=A0A6I6JUJ1_9BACT|nr:response regulator [Maribellus comscasis]QGY46785.1 response regulator [Maribellus comscasis]